MEDEWNKVQAARSEEKCQAPEPEEKAMQPQLAQCRQSRPGFGSPLEALEAIHLELRAQTAPQSSAYCWLRCKIQQRRQLPLEH